MYNYFRNFGVGNPYLLLLFSLSMKMTIMIGHIPHPGMVSSVEIVGFRPRGGRKKKLKDRASLSKKQKSFNQKLHDISPVPPPYSSDLTPCDFFPSSENETSYERSPFWWSGIARCSKRPNFSLFPALPPIVPMSLKSLYKGDYFEGVYIFWFVLH